MNQEIRIKEYEILALNKKLKVMQNPLREFELIEEIKRLQNENTNLIKEIKELQISTKSQGIKLVKNNFSSRDEIEIYENKAE